jgi:ribose/xylose/arabinose/galactoside ABC-type transport system permease subunit
MRVGEFWILACLGLILLLAVLTDRLRQGVLRRKGLI